MLARRLVEAEVYCTRLTAFETPDHSSIPEVFLACFALGNELQLAIVFLHEQPYEEIVFFMMKWPLLHPAYTDGVYLRVTLISLVPTAKPIRVM